MCACVCVCARARACVSVYCIKTSRAYRSIFFPQMSPVAIGSFAENYLHDGHKIIQNRVKQDAGLEWIGACKDQE